MRLRGQECAKRLESCFLRRFMYPIVTIFVYWAVLVGMYYFGLELLLRIMGIKL